MLNAPYKPLVIINKTSLVYLCNAPIYLHVAQDFDILRNAY